MRVGIFLLSLKDKLLKGGFFNYSRCILKALDDSNPDIEIYVFINKSGAFFLDFDFKNLKLIKRDFIKKFPHLFEPYLVPYFVQKYKLDAVHFPIYGGPVKSKIPLIITVHDLAFLINKKFIEGFLNRFYWLKIFKKGVLKASKLIAVSENTKRDLIKYWKIDERKIETLFNGSLFEYFKPEKEIDVLKKFNLEKEKYFLMVGTIEPRKNHLRVLKAFDIFLKKEERNFKLVIAGKKGWGKINILGKIKELKIEKNVILADSVSDEELYFLYKNSLSLVYPSLYEGFGLPLVEAMSLGIPVLTSNISPLADIVNDAGIKVNPFSIEEIYMGLKKLFRDKDFLARLKMKAKERAQIFSWRKHAEKLLKIYKEVVCL